MVLLHAVRCVLVSVVAVQLVERVVERAGGHVVLAVVQHNHLALVSAAETVLGLEAGIVVLGLAAGIAVLEEEANRSVASCRPPVVGSDLVGHQAEADSVALAGGSRFDLVGLHNVSIIIRCLDVPSSSIRRTKKRVETFAKS